MKMKYFLVLCLFFQIGCAFSRINHFRKEVNACLVNDNAYSQSSHKNYETTSIFEGDLKEQIRLEKIKKGDWYKILYKITYNNIKVISGTWQNQELIFLVKDSWPTEESGILLMKPLWPFRDNIPMVFEINQTHGKNLIVKFYPANLENNN